MELWTLHREALSPQHREARHNGVKDFISEGRKVFIGLHI